MPSGEFVRKALKPIRDWNKALDTIRKWESEGARPASQDTVTIDRLRIVFLEDAQARNLGSETIRKYKQLFKQLAVFAKDQGVENIRSLDLPMLTAFRAKWKDGPLSSGKKLERLRSVLQFAVSRKWLEENPSVHLKAPKYKPTPTMPFSRDQMFAILKAATEWLDQTQAHGRDNARRMRALILLLRYSGLRIGDAVGCLTDRLAKDKLRLYTQKTGTHVYVPLPDFVVKELDAIPKMSTRHWFWTGNGKLETAVKDWQARLQTIMDNAKVKDGHAHRFRDTFAIELLLHGTRIERVSILLGHTSVKITEKHYAPWTRERQDQAEADVRATWGSDPLAVLESKRTETVQIPPRSRN